MLTIDSLLEHGAPPVVAILRGIKPEEAVAVATVLVDAGVRMIEVPLNSPNPFASIAAMQSALGDRALFGAGTVLDVHSVERLAETGARLMVTPNVSPEVIRRGVDLGLEVMPGFQTPTEAFTAIAAGATRLKLFPAFAQGPAYLKAVREVLPGHVSVWAVGGVDVGNVAGWLAAGAEGVATGGGVYRPGRSAYAVGQAASEMLAAIGRG